MENEFGQEFLVLFCAFGVLFFCVWVCLQFACLCCCSCFSGAVSGACVLWFVFLRLV